jgi:hypothetical protein
VAKKRKRSTKKTGQKAGTNLVAQPHGGAINQGAPAHPVAGTGRPPSAVRAVLRVAYEQRVQLLTDLADGKPVTLRVATTSKNSKGERTVTSKRRVFTPGVGERLAAMEQLARYGIGTTKEVSIEEVKAKVEAMLNVLKQELEPALYERLLPELRQAFLTA